MTTLRQLVLPLVLVSLLAPAALASSRGYVGGGGEELILCTAGTAGSDVGGGCEFTCATTCRVRVVDDLLAPQSFRVCDWDGVADVNCLSAVGELQFTSATGTIDVFVSVGTTGTIYVD